MRSYPKEEAAGIQEALDERAYERMQDTEPVLVKRITKAVQAGMTAPEVSRLVYREERSPWLAAKCKQVARYVERVIKQED